ncbi:MAG: hypothetical protein R3190_08710 [Thermoanaerobaculia bacterium]|nr:hypothetical protein [Thermoanaerobaculia bacterium]
MSKRVRALCVTVCLALAAAPWAAAQEETGQDESVWRLGEVARGKRYPTTVSATNMCKGKHDFQIEVEGAVADFLLVPDPVIRQVARKETKSAEATFDLTEVEPGSYEGVLRTTCITCKRCDEDHPRIKVLITVIDD